MKSKSFQIVAFVLIASFLAGCSEKSPTSAPQETPTMTSQYLDITSESIEMQGKSDFDSLVLDKDDFTKQASYYLPKNEKNKIVLEKIQYEFFLHKPSDSNEFRPVIEIAYSSRFDWLFMESAIFKINDEVMNFAPTRDPVRQTLTGGIAELLYFELTNEQVNFLGKTKSITDLDIRVYTETLKEMKLNGIEYKGLKKILSAYRYYLSTIK